MDKRLDKILLGSGVILFAILIALLLWPTTPTSSGNVPVPATNPAAVLPSPIPPLEEPVKSEAVSTQPPDLSKAAPETPPPDELALLLPEQINAADPVNGGYAVYTTFGKKWFLSDEIVTQLPQSMKIRIDYGKYGSGSVGQREGQQP